MKLLINPFKFISRLSFRKRITISLILLSFLMTFFLGISSYQLSSNIILNMSKKLSENNFDVVYNSLENYFSSVEKYSTLLLRISTLRPILQKKYYANSENNTDDQQLGISVREIINLALSNDKITFNTISIYCKNGYNYNYFKSNNSSYNDFESCIKYYTNEGYISTGYKSSTWCDLIQVNDIMGKKSFSFINIRMLYDISNFEEAGILITGIDEDNLHSIYSSFSDKAYILHNDGQVISNSDKSLLGKSFSNDSVYIQMKESTKSMDTLAVRNANSTQLITFKKLAYYGVYFIVPFDYYNGIEIDETKSFNISILFLFLIGFFTSIIFALLLSKGLSSSVLSLKKTVQAVYQGDLTARFKSTNHDEVSYLGEKFNEMLNEINNFFIRQKEQENTNKTLELKLMQSQINPHLLYNTLDSILWALDNKNTVKAKNLIISLSEFFKITLSGGNDLIPLQKELELVSNYIYIQKLARGKNITLSIRAPDNLLNINIIKLSIQPIIENTILHGFSGFRDDGAITITVSSFNNESLEIVIEDNGIGIPEYELFSINEILGSYPMDTNIKHFGLYNIQRRIKNLFGNEYGIILESEVGVFTRIIMRLPINRIIEKDDIENV